MLSQPSDVKPRASLSVPILLYHNIGEPPKESGGQGLYVKPQLFNWQLTLLKTLNIKGVSLKDAQPYLKGEKKGRIAVLTFDDGYRDNLTRALPLLKAFDFSATCFIVSDAIGATNTWDHHRSKTKKPLMTREEIREWLIEGQDIGAHSRSHVDLRTCNAQALTSEIQGSKEALEDLFQRPIPYFFYPYGFYSQSVYRKTKEVGFVGAVTTEAGYVTEKTDPYLWPRLNIKGSKGWRRLLLGCLHGFLN